MVNRHLYTIYDSNKIVTIVTFLYQGLMTQIISEKVFQFAFFSYNFQILVQL
jgi:hypothetical protein